MHTIPVKSLSTLASRAVMRFNVSKAIRRGVRSTYRPILEPYDLQVISKRTVKVQIITYMRRGNMPPKGDINVVVNRFSRLWSQVCCVRILLESELGPTHEMDDLDVNSVRPVVPEYPDVLYDV